MNGDVTPGSVRDWVDTIGDAAAKWTTILTGRPAPVPQAAITGNNVSLGISTPMLLLIGLVVIVIATRK